MKVTTLIKGSGRHSQPILTTKVVCLSVRHHPARVEAMPFRHVRHHGHHRDRRQFGSRPRRPAQGGPRTPQTGETQTHLQRDQSERPRIGAWQRRQHLGLRGGVRAASERKRAEQAHGVAGRKRFAPRATAEEQRHTHPHAPPQMKAQWMLRISVLMFTRFSLQPQHRKWADPIEQS